jgi:hypothetical protein
MTDPDPRLRFRIYVEGEIADEEWIDTTAPGRQDAVDALMARQLDIAHAAQADGELWMVEVFDPEQPEHQAYARFGTDKRGMILPIQTVRLPGMN